MGSSDQAAFISSKPSVKLLMNVDFVNAERFELAEAATGCDSEVEPAVAEPVDGGHRRRQLQRIMQRCDEHRDTEPQPGRARGGVGQ